MTLKDAEDYKEFEDKNLLIITQFFPNSGGDQTGGIFVKEQVDILKRYFSNIYVIVPVPLFPILMRNNAAFSDYSYDNVKVYYKRYPYTPFPRESLPFSDELRNLILMNALEDVIRRYGLRFDLIHCHFLIYADIAVNFKKKFNCPLIATAHEVGIRLNDSNANLCGIPFRDRKWNSKMKEILKETDLLIGIDRYIYSYVKKLGVEHQGVTVIPNIVDQTKFCPMNKFKCRELLSIPHDKKIVLAVGNLVAKKGYEFLLEAASIMDDEDTIFYIIGAGPLKSQLQNKIKRLDLESNVILAGSKQHDELPVWYNASDVFVFPSLSLPDISTGNGVVLIESLSCGQPVVTTINEELDEYAELAVIVEPANSMDLARGIVKALTKEWSREAILSYARRFNATEVSKQILDNYLEILSKNGSA